MAETNDYKQVFMTYPVQQQNGNFYHIDYLPEWVPIEYPKTVDPIPDELKGKIPKYSWQTKEWIDSGIDPTTAAITALQANAAILMAQFSMIKSTLTGLQKQVATLTKSEAATTTTKGE